MMMKQFWQKGNQLFLLPRVCILNYAKHIYDLQPDTWLSGIWWIGELSLVCLHLYLTKKKRKKKRESPSDKRVHLFSSLPPPDDCGEKSYNGSLYFFSPHSALKDDLDLILKSSIGSDASLWDLCSRQSNEHDTACALRCQHRAPCSSVAGRTPAQKKTTPRSSRSLSPWINAFVLDRKKKKKAA